MVSLTSIRGTSSMEISKGYDIHPRCCMISYDDEQANILMNANERACLADFGLTTIICDTIPGYSITTANDGTARWTAPELFVPELCGLAKSVHSKESDVYAFGMVIYEVNSLV
jgi:serine/threonine protein kinase